MGAFKGRGSLAGFPVGAAFGRPQKVAVVSPLAETTAALFVPFSAPVAGPTGAVLSDMQGQKPCPARVSLLAGGRDGML